MKLHWLRNVCSILKHLVHIFMFFAVMSVNKEIILFPQGESLFQFETNQEVQTLCYIGNRQLCCSVIFILYEYIKAPHVETRLRELNA